LKNRLRNDSLPFFHAEFSPNARVVQLVIINNSQREYCIGWVANFMCLHLKLIWKLWISGKRA